jgi:gamma-glutamylcyclotransferase (GGCT)/AIG2-like uncharacterized protein YtfP
MSLSAFTTALLRSRLSHDLLCALRNLITFMKYFAYGCTMLEEWLQTHLSGAKFLATGYVPGWVTSFEVAGADGSGKTNMRQDSSGVIQGVVYDVPEDQLQKLDELEGPQYWRMTIEVFFQSRGKLCGGGLAASLLGLHKDEDIFMVRSVHEPG